jgi:hypothetical protein
MITAIPTPPTIPTIGRADEPALAVCIADRHGRAKGDAKHATGPGEQQCLVETRPAVGGLEAVATGRAELHDVTVLGEEPNEKSPEARIILDHEQVHRTGLTRVSERTLKNGVAVRDSLMARTPRMGNLTNQQSSVMIQWSAEANRRWSPTRSRHRSGQETSNLAPVLMIRTVNERTRVAMPR